MELAGNRTVPIEIGSKYTDTDWSQKLMTIREFVQRFVQRKNEKEEEGNGGDARQNKGYLAQHPLFDQVLAHDYFLGISWQSNGPG
jgi:hypothetical protein